MASSKVFRACFVHSCGRLSRNSSAKIPKLATLWCSISRTVQTNALFDNGGLPLWEAINWSHSCLRTPAVGYILSWPSSTLIWIDSHPIPCCFLFLLLMVLLTFFKCASWVIFLVATIAVSRGQTGVCIAAVSRREAPCWKRLSFGLIRLQSPLVEVFLEPWLAVVETWGRWSRKEVGSAEDYIVSYKSKWNEWQPTSTFNPNWILLCIGALRIAAGDSNVRAICSKLVQCCWLVYRDTSRWTIADISCLIDIKRTFFHGKDFWWCLSEDIAGILHESHANYQVIMYS